MRRPVLLALSALILAACGGSPPLLLPIGDQELAAGETLSFDVKATDSDTASLTLTAERVPAGATFTQYSGTAAEFRWNPTAADVGDHQVDFIVSDGSTTDSERIVITVRSGSSAGPEFIGASTWTLESGQKSIEKIVEVRDDAASAIQWTIQGQPEGATFTPLVKRAVFFWEPTAAQRAQAQYTFTIRAKNPASSLESSRVFTILVQSGGGGGCTGTKPTVASTTADALEGANDFQVTATASDAESKVQQVTLRWAEGTDPAPEAFAALAMQGAAGGAWSATLTLPVPLAAGEFKTITYEICALDDDDASEENACDLEACTPKATFTARMAGGKGLCEPCGGDAECGEAEDLCIDYGTDSFCGTGCTVHGDCPTGYECLELSGGITQCQLPITSASCGPSGDPLARAGDLVINELLADPFAGADPNGDGVASTTGDEFIELVSTASGPIDLGGVTVSDATQVRFTFPIATVVYPGEAVVIFGGGNKANFAPLGDALVFAAAPDPSTGLGLNNSGDEVLVRDAKFDVIAAASYGSEGGNDESLTLQPQVTGITYVKHKSAAGASGSAFSPGIQACSKLFPIAVHGSCGGSACTNADLDVEPNNDRASAGCLSALPAGVDGTLDYRGTVGRPGPDPWDYFAFSATGGRKIDLATFPGAAPAIPDTLVKVLDAQGNVLAENDDPVDANGDPTSLYAEIMGLTIPATGTYFIAVGTYQGAADVTGSYSLLIDYQ